MKDKDYIRELEIMLLELNNKYEKALEQIEKLENEIEWLKEDNIMLIYQINKIGGKHE